MLFDWKSVVGTVAPGIATALGGPLAGMAVSTLAKALGVEATEEAVANVVATNDPKIPIVGIGESTNPFFWGNITHAGKIPPVDEFVKSELVT
jgi:hypothetical protein